MPPPSTFNLNEDRYHLAIANYTFDTAAVQVGALITALSNLTVTGGVNTITVTGTAYDMLTKDGRHYLATLNYATGSRAITTGAFVLPELLSHNPVIEGVIGVMARGATSITVTYT